MNVKVKRSLQIGISLAVLVGSVYYALRGVDLHKLAEGFGQANYWWAMATIPVIVLSHFLRAMRWVTLLSPIRANVSRINAFSAVMIGYFINNLIPRAGELARPFLFSKRENLPMTTTLATVFVERIFDLISLLILIGLTLIAAHGVLLAAFPSLAQQATDAFIPLIVIILIIIGGVVFIQSPMGMRFSGAILSRFSDTIHEKIKGYLKSFTEGFLVFSEPSRYFRISVETVFIWFLYIVPMYLMFFAFDLDSQYNLNFWDANVILVIASIAIAVAPSPGAFGVYHSFVKDGLVHLYGVPDETALAYATVTHAINYLIILLLGAVFFVRENALGVPIGIFSTKLKPDGVGESPS